MTDLTIPDPPPFDPDKLETISKLARLGHTDIEIAEFIGCSLATFNRWKGRHPDLVSALKDGKGYADERVKRSLYERAMGYSYPSEKVFHYQGQIIRAEIMVHVPPDVTAQIFWLKNRDKANWRDVQDHRHSLDTTPDHEVERRFNELQERIEKADSGEKLLPTIEGKANGKIP